MFFPRKKTIRPIELDIDISIKMCGKIIFDDLI